MLSLDVNAHVATVTIDNPPVNALSMALHERITKVFDKLNDRDDVHAVILTAKGHVFCAGANIKARSASVFEEGERWRYNRSFRECVHAIMECRKPVVAAINGPALGGGLAIVASCDILVCSTNACLGLPEIDVGVLGGGRHAMRLFGHSLTRRMAFTGYRVAGPELYRLGVVEECVEPARLMGCARELAEQIAGKSPLAIELAKRGLNAIEEMTIRDGYRHEQDLTADLSKYEDSAEALRAFVERRAPDFRRR